MARCYSFWEILSGFMKSCFKSREIVQQAGKWTLRRNSLFVANTKQMRVPVLSWMIGLLLSKVAFQRNHFFKLIFVIFKDILTRR